MSNAIKIKPPTAEKYKDMSTFELREELLKRDSKNANEKIEEVLNEQRVVRMGSMAVLSLLLGLVYEMKPDLKAIWGTPVSLDHLAALGGGAGAFMSDDETVAQACEGIANAGLVPVIRGMGALIGSFTVK